MTSKLCLDLASTDKCLSPKLELAPDDLLTDPVFWLVLRLVIWGCEILGITCHLGPQQEILIPFVLEKFADKHIHVSFSTDATGNSS